jgi:hypothetical protein
MGRSPWSSGEAWAQAVHPDHRRMGSALRLAMPCGRGPPTARPTCGSMTNGTPSQAASDRFRRISDWRRGERAIGGPVPEESGPVRVPPLERLDDAPSAEAEPAFLSWSTGELARAARGLLPITWVWRTMTVDHLTLAARNHNLLEGRPGWAIAEVDDEGGSGPWLERHGRRPSHGARPADRAGGGRDQMKVMVPAVDWLTEAFAARPANSVGIWARRCRGRPPAGGNDPQAQGCHRSARRDVDDMPRRS